MEEWAEIVDRQPLHELFLNDSRVDGDSDGDSDDEREESVM